MSAPAEPCLDARLTLGAALAALASSACSLALGAPVPAIAQACAGLVLAWLTLAGSRRRAVPPVAVERAAPVPGLVDHLVGEAIGHLIRRSGARVVGAADSTTS